MSWTKLSLLWFGRINSIKMDILPKYLYLFQTLPIKLRKTFFKKRNKLLLQFIWRNNKPRINLKTLCQSKDRGGAGLPDFECYYKAVIFSRVLDWFHHSVDKQWVQLEIGSSPLNPKAALWLCTKDIGPRSSWPLLTYTVLECWHHYLKIFPLSSIPSPLTPLIDNPSLPIGMHSNAILSWDKSYWPQIRHTILEGIFMPFVNFQTLHDQKKGIWFVYLQLQSFYSSLTPKHSIHQSLTDFEQLCLSLDPPAHTISKIYMLLSTLKSPGLPPYAVKWELELSRSIQEEEWVQIFNNTHKFSIACDTQEHNLKLLSRWYRTPVNLNRMFPAQSD